MDNKERNAIIATNIKKYIIENKITQKELASKIGVSPSTMSDYMNLRSNPSHGVIQKIADYFKINKSDIDTTYKETSNTSSIETIYNKLNSDRKEKVISFAKEQLEEQTSIVEFPQFNEEGTLAAHSAEHDKTFDDKEVDKINSYLDKLDEEYDAKNNK